MSDIKTIHNKLDVIIDKINQIEVSQSRTEIIMDTHIKRTALAEQNLQLLRDEFKPIKNHVDFINNTAKLVAGLAATFLLLKQMGWWEKLIQFFLS